MGNLYVTIATREPIIVNNKVNVSGAWDCDEEIYPMLRYLWSKGYDTAFSCSGHVMSEVNAPHGREVVILGSRDCYIALRTNTVINDISEYKVGWAKVQVVNEWDSIKRVIKAAGIPLPLDFECNILNPETKKIVNDAIILTNGDPVIATEMIDRLHGEAKTYILRAMIPERTRKRMTTYLDHYKALCKCRSDLIKLIEKLPDNRLEE
ncbi:MAG: hypothetical protein J6U54_12710 [Clostridiales bacterium]|nr:hypothetical protein [Clostridiales bacterium]